MLLLMCEGALGMFIVNLSLEEIVLALFYLPWYAIKGRAGVAFIVVGMIFWAIFMPPIWGFVIVGQMLVDWGQSVTLYY